MISPFFKGGQGDFFRELNFFKKICRGYTAELKAADSARPTVDFLQMDRGYTKAALIL